MKLFKFKFKLKFKIYFFNFHYFEKVSIGKLGVDGFLISLHVLR